jgi:hypothetical protein
MSSSSSSSSSSSNHHIIDERRIAFQAKHDRNSILFIENTYDPGRLVQYECVRGGGDANEIASIRLIKVDLSSNPPSLSLPPANIAELFEMVMESKSRLSTDRMMYNFHLKIMKDRKIVLVASHDKWVIKTKVNGKLMILLRVSVHVKMVGLLPPTPTIEYVLIEGVDEHGKHHTEQVIDEQLRHALDSLMTLGSVWNNLM